MICDIIATLAVIFSLLLMAYLMGPEERDDD